ncbi:MAG: diacylglycerol kinase family lipid kinase [Myxococcales bacterium]|nr:diacylglycerol kinase family lipid kinase [Myxococcales bacterium]
MSGVPDLFVAIVNPESGSGRGARRWPVIEGKLREALAARGELEVVATRGPRDATRAAREAALGGAVAVLAAGGDGTLSEVVAGVLAAGAAETVALGLVPLGTGGDYPRTLGITDAEHAVDVIARGNERRVDAGRVEYVDDEGRAREGWFANEASLGLSAEVAHRVSRASKRLGGVAAFAQAAVRTIAAFRPAAVRVRVDEAVVHEGDATLVAIANGRYFGGAMRIAPDARLDDGAFDVVVGGELGKAELVARLLPSIYTGRHVEHPGVAVVRGRRVAVEALRGPVRLEADGETLGATPLRAEVLPGALRFLAPEPRRRPSP